MAHRSSLRIAAAGVLSLAVACGGDNGVGPMKPADPLATAANIQALNTSFGSPAFQSFAFASNYSPTATSPMTPLRTLLRVATPALRAGRALSPTESRLAAAALSAALVPRSGPAPMSIFPPGVVLGTVYEWNPTSFLYEPTARSGAPPNGVRFILYALDAGGLPIVSQEIGYVDLMDESVGDTQTLHIVVVGTTTDPPVTYLDYTVSATTTSGSVKGFITDGTHRLDFNVAVTSSASSYVVDIRFDVNADNAHIRLKLTFTVPDPNTLRLAVNFRLQFGTEVVTVTGTDDYDVNTGSESGMLTVRVNGGIYASIRITDGVPSYTGGGGQELTADDLTALTAIFDAVGAIFGRFDELLAPAGSLGL